MPDDARVAEIAASLTKAQRECVLVYEPDTYLAAGDAGVSGVTTKYLSRIGLLSADSCIQYVVYEPTPLGLAVRAHLIAQQSGREAL